MTLIETSTLRERVRELIANTFVVDATDVPDDVSQANFSRWTSLYHMMLLVVLEEEFGVSFSLDEMTAMTSLDRIVEVLAGHGATA